MKRAQKIVIMIAVLLAPVLVFLFLKQFGKNQFELPIFYPNGNPVAACNAATQPHTLSADFISSNNIKLPALFYFPGLKKIKYYSDLDNVLEKYKKITVVGVYEVDSMANGDGASGLNLTTKSYMWLINCEVVLGEDQWLGKAIYNKYVLVDNLRQIRGYFDCNKLSEIERLDAELDILMNY